MALKRTKFTREAALPTNAVATLFDATQKKANQQAATLLIQVLAEVFDAIGDGMITHLTFGKPRNGKSFLTTVNYDDGNRQYIAGGSLFEMIEQLGQELIEVTGGTEG